MANDEDVARLQQGVAVWNDWRAQNPEYRVHLSGANLPGTNLYEAKLYEANLHGATLSEANLGGANLREANLGGANLREANLRGATLAGADLRGATLGRADLSRADLSGADLRADLGGAKLYEANLSGADLAGAFLSGAFLGRADVSRADVSRADLSEAKLYEANLSGADLHQANLGGANLGGANLRGANLRGADLHQANLGGANLREAFLSGATLYETVFANVDLSTTKSLETCTHMGPSTIDHLTLQRSGRLPLIFLRGCGLPDRLIDYLPSLLEEAIQYYSCFISYSSKDDAFAKRLHADLQNTGVRCWFAPHDLPIGAKTWDAIDAAIRVRDKLLLILSKNAIASDWVEDEVSKAFAEERRRNQIVLFPVRIDETVMKTGEPWAVKLRDQRNIGDFRRWKEHDTYQQAFDRVLRDLKAVPG